MENINDAELRKEEREQVIELGSDITKGDKGNIYTLTVIGQIEGHQVLPETVKTTNIDDILDSVLNRGVKEEKQTLDVCEKAKSYIDDILDSLRQKQAHKSGLIFLKKYRIIKLEEVEYVRESDNKKWHFYDIIAQKKVGDLHE